jgi:glycerol uptake facilitator-like aquaporin
LLPQESCGSSEAPAQTGELIIVHTSKRKATVGTEAAIAIGATITVCGLWGGPLTGVSMNPARSFGPALLGHHLSTRWIYAVGHAVGAIAAVTLAFVIHALHRAANRELPKGRAMR